MTPLSGALVVGCVMMIEALRKGLPHFSGNKDVWLIRICIKELQNMCKSFNRTLDWSMVTAGPVRHFILGSCSIVHPIADRVRCIFESISLSWQGRQLAGGGQIT